MELKNQRYCRNALILVTLGVSEYYEISINAVEFVSRGEQERHDRMPRAGRGELGADIPLLVGLYVGYGSAVIAGYGNSGYKTIRNTLSSWRQHLNTCHLLLFKRPRSTRSSPCSNAMEETRRGECNPIRLGRAHSCRNHCHMMAK